MFTTITVGAAGADATLVAGVYADKDRLSSRLSSLAKADRDALTLPISFTIAIPQPRRTPGTGVPE